MTEGRLEDALKTLREEQVRLRGQYEAARGTAKNLEDEARRVQKAIAALLGEAVPRPRSTRAASKSLTGEEVVALIERVLRKDGPTKEPQLKARVGELVLADGRSRKGLHFSFAKALKDPRFRWTGARWGLRETS